MVLEVILHFYLMNNRVFIHQLEVKFGNFYWVAMILTALLTKESKYDSTEGIFLSKMLEWIFSCDWKHDIRPAWPSKLGDVTMSKSILLLGICWFRGWMHICIQIWWLHFHYIICEHWEHCSLPNQGFSELQIFSALTISFLQSAAMIL